MKNFEAKINILTAQIIPRYEYLFKNEIFALEYPVWFRTFSEFPTHVF